jgi:hypothetical protein
MGPLMGVALFRTTIWLVPSWRQSLPFYFVSLLALTCGALRVRYFGFGVMLDAGFDVSIQDSVSTDSTRGADKIKYASISNNMSAVEQTRVQRSKRSPSTKIFYVILGVNTLLHGVFSIYESHGRPILRDDYQLQNRQVEFLVATAAAVGVIQLVLFKQLWARHVAEVTLVLAANVAIMLALVLVVSSWSASYKIPFWRFGMATYIIYAFGYPIVTTLLWSLYSQLGRDCMPVSMHQGLKQSVLDFTAFLARVVFPLISGYIDEDIKGTGSFALALILTATTIALMVFNRDDIIYYTSGATHRDGIWGMMLIALSFSMVLTAVGAMIYSANATVGTSDTSAHSVQRIPGKVLN